MTQKPRFAEMHPGPGFRIRPDFPRLPRELMQAYEGFTTPDISDLLNRMYALYPAIHCLTGKHHRLVGPACTVKVFPGDNLMVHKALDIAKPGDIIVVDAGASVLNATLGELVCTKARHRKIAGFIVDGFIRDLPEVLELDFPVFARGTTPIGPLQRGPGEINYSISCGGRVINPGDLMVGDQAGIVVVPQEIAEELLGRLTKHREALAAYTLSVQQGDFSNAWVDRILDAAGCPTIEDTPKDPAAPSRNGSKTTESVTA
jgi:RraA family protein